MPILDRIEAILDRLPDRPLVDTLAELSRLAHAEPNNPAPHLAMTIVSAFARHERADAAQHLQRARALLAQANLSDPEMQFAKALCDAISYEFRLLSLERPVRGSATAGALFERARADRGATGAIQSMADIAAKKLGHSTLAATLTAALQSLARAITPNEAKHGQGVTALGRLSANGNSQSLAAFFLVYAHRRVRNYPEAIRVAHSLEQKHPNSAMVKMAIGSCHAHSRDLVNAERYYRQALALAPHDPAAHLGLANVLTKRGQLDQARDVADDVVRFDAAGKLRILHDALLSDIAVRAALPHRRVP